MTPRIELKLVGSISYPVSLYFVRFQVADDSREGVSNPALQTGNLLAVLVNDNDHLILKLEYLKRCGYQANQGVFLPRLSSQ